MERDYQERREEGTGLSNLLWTSKGRWQSDLYTLLYGIKMLDPAKEARSMCNLILGGTVERYHVTLSQLEPSTLVVYVVFGHILVLDLKRIGV